MNWMITDARVLRDEFTPQELHHRGGVIDALSTAWGPVVEGRSAEHVTLHGPSGAGKSTIVEHSLRLLESETLDLRWGFVNCISQNTKAAVLHELVQDSGLGKGLQREGTHAATALDRLREYDGQFVAVLDEVDVLDDPMVTTSLYEIPNVAVVLICIDEDDFFAHADSRVKSRFQAAETITLQGYTHSQMKDILNGRIEHGLAASRVDDAAVDRIADLAAGDARRGITLLRRAATHVEDHDDVRELTADVVDAIRDDAAAEERTQRVRDLGTHLRLLYEIVQEAGRIDAGTLHARYEDQIADPRAESTRRKYLASLERYDLIEHVGTTRNREYRV